MKKDLHIAFIHQEFPYGGAEKITLLTANYLCTHGYKVTILTARHNEHLYPQGSVRQFCVELLPSRHIKSSKAVAQAIRSYACERDIHILVTSRELLYAKWLKAKTGIKLVFQLHSSPYYEFRDIAEKKANSPVLQLLYGCGVERLLTQFYRNKYRRVYGWADAYGVLCNAYKQVVVDELRLSSTSKLWVLPNAIEPVGSVVYDKQKTILFVGRLSHRDKRVDRLLRIWQLAQPQMPGWKLKIVGDGRERKKLQVLASRLQLQQLSFEGHTNNVKNYYDEASLLCLTSSFEGWPLSVAEAQAYGVVPIMFDSFLGAHELIQTTDDGILVAPFDEMAYAKALVELSTDLPRLTKMRHRVIEKAKEYTIQKMGEEWQHMLNHIVE
ncbi:MAG: glycosyltransferase [Prevotella sp.]|nr:glycosyltransferase [Prevotella sp.]